MEGNSVLLWNSPTKGEQPLHSMQCAISPGSDTQQHGHRDTKAASSSEVAVYVTRVLKEDVSIAPVERWAVCSLLPVTSVLTQGTKFGQIQNQASTQ